MEKEFKVYTKGGDSGKTSLIGGKRVTKHDLQVEAYGMVDELKAYTGLLYDFTDDLLCKKTLIIIIEKLFVAESLMACDTYERTLALEQISETDIKLLEDEIDRMTKYLKPLKSFILPGGHPLISHAHIARTICRRAERAYLRHLDSAEDTITNNEIRMYLNRLSDYYFTLARYSAKILDIDELLWTPKK
jgi:cob(I)alamin adenosyltransferase